MPTRSTFGGVRPIQAFAQLTQTWSMHMGSLPWMAGISGKQTHSFVPARSCVGWPSFVAGQSMTVALSLIEAGAALTALLILAFGVTRCPVAAQAAVTRRTPSAGTIGHRVRDMAISSVDQERQQRWLPRESAPSRETRHQHCREPRSKQHSFRIFIARRVRRFEEPIERRLLPPVRVTHARTWSTTSFARPNGLK